MKTTNKPVEVQLPVVKIRVEDLSYLMGLANEQPGIKCHVPQGNFSRLMVLGLIERYEIPPCPDELAKYERNKADLEAKIRAAVKPKSIDIAALDGLSFYSVRNKPKPRESTRITQAGRNLIKDGMAKVQVAKSCR